MSVKTVSGSVILLATIRDVAAKAGVSKATVSRVLNRTTDVREDTRQRVLQAIRELNYCPNAQARGLTSGQTKVIGVLVPAMNSSFYGPILEGCQSTLLSAGYNMMVCSTYHRRGTELSFTKMLTEKRVDALLMITPRELSGEQAKELITTCQLHHLPVLVADADIDIDSVSSISFDNLQGGYKATAHLLSLGHRRIGIVLGTAEAIETIHRFRGYKQALRDAGVDLDESLVAVAGSYQEEAALEVSQELLRKNVTAIFACSDNLALGVLEAARLAGRQVPKDISLVGFDDVAFSSWLCPKLTTIQLPKAELGQLAAKRIINTLNGEETAVCKTILPVSLIERESTRRRDAAETAAPLGSFRT